ncbi:MAG: nucleotidyltransferase domain-containing protein [Bacteroidia bacterium]|nr:nucleotidyltransferase domain-containing protein [Bacteroidia bacterium]
MNDGLTDAVRDSIRSILSSHPGVEKAVVFGSRAMGSHVPESDIDICLFGTTLTLTDQVSLAAVMDALPIPQKVDLLRYHTISNRELIEHIDRVGMLLYHRSTIYSR